MQSLTRPYHSTNYSSINEILWLAVSVMLAFLLNKLPILRQKDSELCSWWIQWNSQKHQWKYGCILLLFQKSLVVKIYTLYIILFPLVLRKIMTIIMFNILIANASDSYAITILEGPVGDDVCSSRICTIKSIHKIPLSQNIYVLVAKSLSRPCLDHKQTWIDHSFSQWLSWRRHCNIYNYSVCMFTLIFFLFLLVREFAQI